MRYGNAGILEIFFTDLSQLVFTDGSGMLVTSFHFLLDSTYGWLFKICTRSAKPSGEQDRGFREVSLLKRRPRLRNLE